MKGMTQPLSSRRQFLTGTGAFNPQPHHEKPDQTQFMAQHGDGAGPASADRPPPIAPSLTYESEWVTVSRTAMACQFEVLLPPGPPSHVAAALSALDLVDALEAQLTVYRDTSEVVRLNRHAAHRWVPVEAGLFDLLQLAKRLHTQTAGAFDITAGPLIKAWGFFKRAGNLPEPRALEEARQRVGSHFILLDEAARAVRFDREGVEINLGAIGKGYALDRARKLLEERGVPEFLLHGGRSSVLARVAKDGVQADQAGWLIGVRHPLFPHRRLAEVRLCNQALGTSGSGVQFFRHEGKRYGHILDPRTGWPAEGVYSATVVAPTAAEADALSTAFYILGPDAAADYCRSHPGVGMLLVACAEDGVELHAEGLLPGQWRLLDDGARLAARTQ
jgi:thiamine biosynthesis lipoprotein